MSPLGDGVDLGLGAGDTGFRNENAENQLHVVGASGGAHILEGITIGAVDADRGEAHRCHFADVSGHGRGVFATLRGGVGGICHAKLVAVGCDCTG